MRNSHPFARRSSIASLLSAAGEEAEAAFATAGVTAEAFFLPTSAAAAGVAFVSFKASMSPLITLPFTSLAFLSKYRLISLGPNSIGKVPAGVKLQIYILIHRYV